MNKEGLFARIAITYKESLSKLRKTQFSQLFRKLIKKPEQSFSL